MRDKWVAQPPAALSLGTCPQPGWPLGDAGLGARPLGLSGWSRQDGQQEVLSAVRAGRAQQGEEEGWRGLVCSAVLSPWHPNFRPSSAAPQPHILPAMWAPGAVGPQGGSGGGWLVFQLCLGRVPHSLSDGVGARPCQVCSHLKNLPRPWRPPQGSRSLLSPPFPPVSKSSHPWPSMPRDPLLASEGSTCPDHVHLGVPGPLNPPQPLPALRPAPSAHLLPLPSVRLLYPALLSFLPQHLPSQARRPGLRGPRRPITEVAMPGPAPWEALWTGTKARGAAE